MRSQRWMVWSGSAATVLLVVAQFIPVRSLVVEEEGFLALNSRMWVLFTSDVQEQGDLGEPFTTTVVDGWRSVLCVLVLGLLVAGLVLARRRSPSAPVLIAGGATSLIGLALWVLATPIQSEFGWRSYVSLEPFESTLTINLNPSVWVGLDVGFYVLALALLSAIVSLVAAVVLAAGRGGVVPPQPGIDAPTGDADE